VSTAEADVIAFGDESENDTHLVYALAIFRSERTDEARAALARMKRSLGVPESTRLHCRVVFSGQRRRGTAWAATNHRQIENAVRGLAVEIHNLNETPEIGVIDRRRVPLLPTSPGHADRVWRAKETLGLAANIAIMGAVSRFGIDRVRFIIDRDKTQIQRGVKWQRADSTRGMFVDLGAGREPVKIEPEVQDDSLLEIADLYAYTALRAQSREPGRLFSELAGIIRPKIRSMGPWANRGEGWTDTANKPVVE
jgi:hypothetical protein